MLRIEKTNVYGFESAIRGMRNPLNSWSKSDSYVDENGNFVMGENDLALAKKLSKAGGDHRKFMRQILVSVDIIAPLYWWAEADTYKVATVRNSCSKMHCLLNKPFEMGDFSFDKLSGYKREVKQFRPDIDEETEVWRKIDADYDVSNQGRVRHGSRILSGSVHQDGYIFVTLHGKQQPIHRLVASEYCTKRDSHQNEVNHIDGNKMNNCSSNLEWVTRRQNQNHAIDNDLQPKGLSTYQGKFTPEQRKEIKQLWDMGKFSKREIAKKFGVSHTCINDICNDKYKYIDKVNLFEEVARPLVDTLNELRDAWFLEEDSDKKREIWYSIIQLLPEAYNQLSTFTLNYEVLRNMYHARKNHKLTEWHTLCDWIKGLPYSELITLEGL